MKTQYGKSPEINEKRTIYKSIINENAKQNLATVESGEKGRLQ
jgi:hypothetical protein